MSGSSRGAPLKSLDDGTPLDGPQVDVAVRIGWQLRMARLLAGERSVESLAEMSRRLEDCGVSISVTSLHRIESGQLRMGHVATAYEQVLGMPPGALRAPADILCRTFSYSPVDRGADRMPESVAEMSELFDRVAGEEVRGGDWLAWARAVVGVGGLGMPEQLVGSLVQRMISEMGRAAGPGYHARYEALSLLRCSAYGHVVLNEARAAIADPHIQVLNDLMSMVGEAVTADARAWAAELLQDPRDGVSFGASLCLENMAEVSGDPGVISGCADLIVAACKPCTPDSARWVWLSHLVRLLPAPTHARTRQQLDHPLAPVIQIRHWSRSRLNTYWTLCQDICRKITADLGIGEQPLLDRLLFEIAMGPHETRSVTSYILLRGLPGLPDPAGEMIAPLASSHPDPVVRERVARRLVGLVHGEMPTATREWLARDHPLLSTALRLAGFSGTPVDPTILRAGIAREDACAAALFAAGMTASPLLAELLADPETSADVRGAAEWWVAQGPRVEA